MRSKEAQGYASLRGLSTYPGDGAERVGKSRAAVANSAAGCFPEAEFRDILQKTSIARGTPKVSAGLEDRPAFRSRPADRGGRAQRGAD